MSESRRTVIDAVVDTSAIVAILGRGAGAGWLISQLDPPGRRTMAAPTLLELGTVVEARAAGSTGIARRVVRDAAIAVVAFAGRVAQTDLPVLRPT